MGQYVGMTVEPRARDAARAAKIAATTPLGREVTLSEAIVAACKVAMAHPEEFAETIRSAGTS